LSQAYTAAAAIERDDMQIDRMHIAQCLYTNHVF